jgi:hypothetical protein
LPPENNTPAGNVPAKKRSAGKRLGSGVDRITGGTIRGGAPVVIQNPTDDGQVLLPGAKAIAKTEAKKRVHERSSSSAIWSPRTTRSITPG